MTVVFLACLAGPIQAGPVCSCYFQEAQSAIEAADAAMGDWWGTRSAADGKTERLAAQVIALGADQYRANLLSRFDSREPVLAELEGRREGSTVRLAGKDWKATIEDGRFAGTAPGGDRFELNKVYRISPTLGLPAPEGAVILFDGTNMDQWETVGMRPSAPQAIRWKLADGAMQVSGGGIISKPKFSDYRLHLEFCCPFQPQARGQGRGNSGVYHQGRYEVQILDSYGLEGKHDECGGIYQIASPRVNMCAPPLQWQTYDVVFHAARYDDQGQKTAPARITVRHNDVLIHENQEVPRTTTSAVRRESPQPEGIHLQDHGNPVRYRNIWVLPLETTD